MDASWHNVLVETVVSPNSSILDAAPMDIDFGALCGPGTELLGICREGQTVTHARVGGDVRIRCYDSLLLMCDFAIAESLAQSKLRRDFVVVERVKSDGTERLKVDIKRALLAPVVVVGMVAASASEMVPMFTAALTAMFVLLITGCVTIRQAVEAANFRLVITIVASYGMAEALEQTGVAKQLAHDMVRYRETNTEKWIEKQIDSD